MQTINCTITKIAEALRATGSQIIASTLVVSRDFAFSLRGMLRFVEQGAALLLRRLGLVAPAMAPVGLVMLHQQHSPGCVDGRPSGSATSYRWSANRLAVGSLGNVSIG